MKILFLGLRHRPDDDRLKYKQAYKIKKVSPSTECAYLGNNPSFNSDSDSLLKILPVENIPSKIKFMYKFLKTAIQYRPDVLQASDIRELIPAMIICSISRSKLIYDSHEDYFNQCYEYSGKTLRGLLLGIFYRGLEVLFSRFAYAVFCADEYIYDLYSKPYFGCKRVYFLRNFTNLEMVKQKAMPPKPSEPLKLVFVGGISIYRGILECSEYVRRYNAEKGKVCLTFDLFGDHNSVVDQAVELGGCQYKGFIPHEDIMQVLSKYHIGVCLFRHIKKYERNLPIKNFEYMSVGLPVITNNFGNLRKYIDQAQSGFCIDSTNYQQFKDSVEKLMNPDVWTIYSNNGYIYTREHLNLDTEIVSYLEIMLSKTIAKKE